MKKKLKIDLLKNGSDTAHLCKIVANHNGGLNPVSLDDISSWLWVSRSIYDINKMDDIFAQKDEEEPNKLTIIQGGKCIAVIEEMEMHELEGAGALID